MFHTGLRKMFALNRDALGRIIRSRATALDCVRPLRGRRVRRHERVAGRSARGDAGARGDRLPGVAERFRRPGAARAGGRRGDRLWRRKRVRFIDTPHTPHGWDAGVLYEETTGTLMCGDLFTQLGDGPALTEGDWWGRRSPARTVPLLEPQPRDGRDAAAARRAGAADACAHARAILRRGRRGRAAHAGGGLRPARVRPLAGGEGGCGLTRRGASASLPGGEDLAAGQQVEMGAAAVLEQGDVVGRRCGRPRPATRSCRSPSTSARAMTPRASGSLSSPMWSRVVSKLSTKMRARGQRRVVGLAHVGAVGADQVEVLAGPQPLAAEHRLGRHGRGRDDVGGGDRLRQVGRRPRAGRARPARGRLRASGSRSRPRCRGRAPGRPRPARRPPRRRRGSAAARESGRASSRAPSSELAAVFHLRHEARVRSPPAPRRSRRRRAASRPAPRAGRAPGLPAAPSPP